MGRPALRDTAPDLSRRLGPPPPDLWDADDCRQLWGAAIEMYVRDATSGYCGSCLPHATEALEDLLGTRVMLARLCDPVELNAETVADAILARLE